MKKVFISAINEKRILVKAHLFVSKDNVIKGRKTYFPGDIGYDEYDNIPVIAWEKYEINYKLLDDFNLKENEYLEV